MSAVAVESQMACDLCFRQGRLCGLCELQCLPAAFARLSGASPERTIHQASSRNEARIPRQSPQNINMKFQKCTVRPVNMNIKSTIENA